MSDFALSFGRLESVLATYFRIDPERAGTFRARLKQLQRLNFPNGVNVGRGVKFEYGLDHTLKLIIALELMSQGLPAKFISEVVENSWPRIQVGLQLVPPSWDDLKMSGDIYLKLKVDMLSDTQDHSYTVEIHDLDSLPLSERSGRPILAIDLSGVLHTLSRSLQFIRYDLSQLTPAIQAWDTGLRTMTGREEGKWMLLHQSWVRDFKRKSLEDSKL